MKFDPLTKPSDVTEEMGAAGFTGLVMHDMAQFELNVGYGVQRLVIAALDGAEQQEIMFALEKGGCLFLRKTENFNQFTLIEAGFDMPCAQIVVALFNAIGTARARVEEFNRQKHPQITQE